MIAGGSTTKDLQQPPDLQGLNLNLFGPPALSTLSCVEYVTVVTNK